MSRTLRAFVGGTAKELEISTFPGVEMPIQEPTKDTNLETLESLVMTLAELAIQTGVLNDPLVVEKGSRLAVSFSENNYYKEKGKDRVGSMIFDIYSLTSLTSTEKTKRFVGVFYDRLEAGQK